MEMEVSVSDLSEIQAAMKRLPGLMALRLQGDGLAAAAKVAQEMAVALAPVKTGRLRSRIKRRRGSQYVQGLYGESIKVPGASAFVVSGAPHTHFFEYGTVHQAAKPFLEPALNGTKAAQFTAFAGAVNKAFARLVLSASRGKVTKPLSRLAGEG